MATRGIQFSGVRDGRGVRRILAALHDIGDIEIRSVDVRFVEVIAPDELALEAARLAIVGAGFSAVHAARGDEAAPTPDDDHGAPTPTETKTCVVRAPIREEQPTAAAPHSERRRGAARRIDVGKRPRRAPPADDAA